MPTRSSPSRIIPRAFPGIRDEEVEQLIANGRVKSYPPGVVLCHENALENTFYLLLGGSVDVTKVINEREERHLKVLETGDFFGEMALIHNAPRAATVKTREEVLVLEIHREAFEKVLKHSSSISLAMVREISNRLRQNDEMAIEDLQLRAGELARAYQRLAEQELARREFLTSVAHELRTPLMTASGYLELIQSGAIKGEEIFRVIDTIARNVRQINALVNDILFLQELDLILSRFEPVNMQKIAETVIGNYTHRARQKNCTIRLIPDPNLPPVSGDAKSLERALTALVDNAIKFSPEGGEVDICAAAVDGRVKVSVRDRGIGIDEETRLHIFDRFYHLDRIGNQLFSGIGLGLAITRQVIQQHNGTLELESEPGKGSTFTMSLRRWGDGT
ncbi:MAG: ATP-binding protein [Chloroflexota bacterium]